MGFIENTGFPELYIEARRESYYIADDLVKEQEIFCYPAPPPQQDKLLGNVVEISATQLWRVIQFFDIPAHRAKLLSKISQE